MQCKRWSVCIGFLSVIGLNKKDLRFEDEKEELTSSKQVGQ